MTENKNMAPEGKRDLKHADLDKFGSERLSVPQTDKTDILTKEQKSKQIRGERGSEAPKKRNIPLALDIIIALSVVIVVAALIVGAYFVLSYYTIGYKNVSIEYTVVVESDDIADDFDASSLEGSVVFCDEYGNTQCFGKVSDASVKISAKGEKQIVFSINSDAKYKKGEGYFVEDHEVAVGSTHRFCNHNDLPDFGAPIKTIRDPFQQPPLRHLSI